MNRKLLDRCFPYFIAVFVACGAFVLFKKSVITFPSGQDILSATITIGSIFSGFLATAMSMVVSIDNPMMNRIRSSKYYHDLISQLKEALFSAIAACVIGLMGFFYDPLSPPLWFAVMWMFVTPIMLLTFLRFTRVMIVIIKASK